jgi:hypothetical protein
MASVLNVQQTRREALQKTRNWRLPWLQPRPLPKDFERSWTQNERRARGCAPSSRLLPIATRTRLPFALGFPAWTTTQPNSWLPSSSCTCSSCSRFPPLLVALALVSGLAFS